MSDEGPQGPLPAVRATTRAPWRAAPALAVAAWPAIFLAVAGALQLWMSVPVDADTATHVAIARLVREHGILHEFPWTTFSWFAHRYADFELAFHLLLAPLSGLDWITASRVAGTLLGAAVLAVCWLLLRAEGVRWAGAWTLAALASSGYFVVRFGIVRPHLLSIPLAVGVTWAAARRRLGPLLILSALYPLCYVGWHAALGLALVAEAARLLAGERPSWRTPAVAAAGLAVGVLAHPQFPAIVEAWWIVNGRILVGSVWGGASGIESGAEFEPFSPGTALRHLTLPLLATVAAAWLAWRSRRRDALPLAFALATLGWATVTLRSARFIEYLVPFAFVALALAARGLPRPRAAAAVALAGGVLFTAASGRGILAVLPRVADSLPAPVLRELDARIPAGAQVFTCDWQLTGRMMLGLPGRRFMVALDPVFFRYEFPELYDRWWSVVTAPPERPARVVAGTFRSSWALCAARPKNREFLRRMAADPGARLVLWNGAWAAFELEPPTGR